jgi:hypothetical protein
VPQVIESTANWHDEYDDPRSALSVRLAVVQDEVRQAIARRSAGPVRLVSVCAGEGRDVTGALASHTCRHAVSAVLVEVDPVHVEAARRRAAAAGLANVTVVQADASLTDSYAGHVPADIVLVCGVFGNIADADIQNTIARLPHLCAAGADVIWTRNLGPRDGSANLTPTIRAWFREAGFRELAFRWTEGGYGIGTHQLASPPEPHKPGRRLFTSFKQRW